MNNGLFTERRKEISEKLFVVIIREKYSNRIFQSHS